MRVYQSNLLIVSGSGQNTGKTTLVCRIVEYFALSQFIVSVKITHHQKSLTYAMPIIMSTNHFVIYNDQNKTQSKDSSRMLAAGAQKSFFIIAEKESVGEAMSALLTQMDTDSAIICESGGLADFYEPGLHLHILGNEDNGKPFRPCNFVVRYDGIAFNLNIENIIFKDKKWKLI